ncbi:MAG: hypothetical protein IJN42_00720, partial [Clostridia bacterium]|nr:hypothetical protein [Clostridia bacterium]
MSEEMKDTSNVMDTAATAQSTAEEVALMEFTDQQVCEYEEGKLSGKEKAKFLLLTPLTNTIIKFCLIGLGLVSLVLLLVGMLVPNALNGLYQI